MPTEQDRIITSRAQLFRYDFCRPNLAPGAQGQYLYGPRDWILNYVSPFPGELAAVSWHTTMPITAGEITGIVLINKDFQGARSAAIPAYNDDTDAYAPVKRGAVTFNAGDTIAVLTNMSADYAPAQLDLLLSLYVMMYVD